MSRYLPLRKELSQAKPTPAGRQHRHHSDAMADLRQRCLQEMKALETRLWRNDVEAVAIADMLGVALPKEAQAPAMCKCRHSQHFHTEDRTSEAKTIAERRTMWCKWSRCPCRVFRKAEEPNERKAG